MHSRFLGTGIGGDYSPHLCFKGLLEKLRKLECTLNRFAKYVGSHLTAFQKKDEWVQKAAEKNKFM